MVTVLSGAGAAVDNANRIGVLYAAARCLLSGPHQGGHRAAGCGGGGAERRCSLPAKRATPSATQLLASYGAFRSLSIGGQTISAQELATNSNPHDIVAWLVSSRQWSTLLHHLTVLTAARARALLRAGADLRATAAPGSPTPRSRSRGPSVQQARRLPVRPRALCSRPRSHGARRRTSVYPRRRECTW